MKKFLATIAVVFFVLLAKAQDFNKFDKGNFIKGNDTIYYRVLFPENFDPKQKYPIVFFLHGSGERGDDNKSQLVHGAKSFLSDSYRKNFPSIVVFPQCPKNQFWANVDFASPSNSNGIQKRYSFVENAKANKIMHALQAMVKDFLKKPFVNKNQAYLGGLSMGAMGTYELLRHQRNTFAAAFAICGGDNINNVKKYKNTPLWIFHGNKDNVVDPAFSIAIAERLKNLGKEVKLSLYPNANHNSWDSAFAEPDLFPWLFSNKRN
jgi:predicted peptidase